MKVLSIIVPCYNSQDYLAHAVHSLIAGGKRVEILLVDDGSTDRTPALIDNYAAQFQGQVRAIHQSNKGHGGAVNAGLQAATCPYVKVCDSDDWLDSAALERILNFLERLLQTGNSVDMLLSNYVYDKVGSSHKKVIRYPRLPRGRFFGWEEVHLRLGQYFLMHSVIYRAAVLTQAARLVLPQHTFYVDNLYVFEPLPFVKKIYYIDVNFYHYFIGRADQSVNEQVMLQRIDQQLYVNKRMMAYYAQQIDDRTALGKYMRYYLEIITTVSSVLLLHGKRPAYLQKKRELWQTLRECDTRSYNRLRRRPLGVMVNLPGRSGHIIALGAYELVRHIYGC